MSDLTATNCGCGNSNRSGCGCNSILWILILLSCCNGGDSSDGCGCGFGGAFSAEITPAVDATALSGFFFFFAAAEILSKISAAHILKIGSYEPIFS